MSGPKPLILPYLGDRHDWGYQLKCHCGSTNVTLLKGSFGGVGIRCWNCECWTQLIDKNSWLRNYEGCGMNNFKKVSTGEVKTIYELEAMFKE